MTDLNKERDLYESVIEKTQDIKMVHLVGISFNEEKNQYEVPDEKWASELTDACLELNTGWFIWQECVKAKAQAVPEWISVDDKWPEYGQSILVVINGLTQTRVFYRDGSDCSEDWIEPVNDEDKNNIWWNKVTYWMPLPTAPSKSGAEG